MTNNSFKHLTKIFSNIKLRVSRTFRVFRIMTNLNGADANAFVYLFSRRRHDRCSFSWISSVYSHRFRPCPFPDKIREYWELKMRWWPMTHHNEPRSSTRPHDSKPLSLNCSYRIFATHSKISTFHHQIKNFNIIYLPTLHVTNFRLSFE